MHPGHLAPLTGIRFVAAVWVVAYHSHLTHGGRWADQHPVVTAALRPLITQGDIAIDVFFVLSGFVLGWNHLDRLGPTWDRRRVTSYVRARFARIWPLYITATLAAGALLWVRHLLWQSSPVERLTWSSFLQQLFMVQQWTSPTVSDTSWVGPAWSISAEWLAYLSFPVLAMVAWRLRARLRASTLVALSLLAISPYAVTVAVSGSLVGEFFWLIRIASEFTAGLLLCAAFTRIQLTATHRTALGLLAALIPLVAVAWFYVSPGTAHLALVLWLPLVPCLAFGSGLLTRFLGHRHLVLAGQASFALYLVHGPAFKLYRDMAREGGVPEHLWVYGELGVALGCLALAILLHLKLEEPARRRLTRPLRREARAPARAARLRSAPSARPTVGQGR